MNARMNATSKMYRANKPSLQDADSGERLEREHLEMLLRPAKARKSATLSKCNREPTHSVSGKETTKQKNSSSSTNARALEASSGAEQGTLVARWKHFDVVNYESQLNSAFQLRGGQDHKFNSDWLKREVEFLKNSNHPQLVRVINDDGGDGIVVERLETTLADLLKKKATLPASTVRTLLNSMLAAIEEYHSRELVHGELDADRIFVTPSGEFKLAGSPGFSPLGEMRSPDDTDRCVAPELLAPSVFGNVSIATDLYCLGHVVLKCLLGKNYFSAIKNSTIKNSTNSDDNFSIAQWHGSSDDRFPPLMGYLAHLPDLCPVLEKMTRKEVSQRQQSTQEVIRDIEKMIIDPQGDSNESGHLGKVAKPILSVRPKNNSSTNETSATSKKHETGNSRAKLIAPLGLLAVFACMITMATSTSASDEKDSVVEDMSQLTIEDFRSPDGSWGPETKQPDSIPEPNNPKIDRSSRVDLASETTASAPGISAGVLNQFGNMDLSQWFNRGTPNTNRLKMESQAVSVEEHDESSSNASRNKEESLVVSTVIKTIEQDLGDSSGFIPPTFQLRTRHAINADSTTKRKLRKLVHEVHRVLASKDWDESQISQLSQLQKQIREIAPGDFRPLMLISIGLDAHKKQSFSNFAVQEAIKIRDSQHEFFVEPTLGLEAYPLLQKIRMMARSSSTKDVNRTVAECVELAELARSQYEITRDIEDAENIARFVACVMKKMQMINASSRRTRAYNINSYQHQIVKTFRILDPRIANAFTECHDALEEGTNTKLEFLSNLNGYVEMKSILRSYD